MRTRKVLRGKQTLAGSALPTVNLLSPWVFEAMAVRRLRQRFVAGGVALTLALAAGWGVQHLRVEQAEQVLTIEAAETERLSEETQALAPVRLYVGQVVQQQATVQETMATEIYFSDVLDGLQQASPPGVEVESATVTLAPPAPPEAPATETPAEDPEADAPASSPQAPASAAPMPSPCPGPDPFNTRVVVGCITVSGSAVHREAVGDFVIALGNSKLFVEPFISTTTTADGQDVTFTGSVGLAERAFSNRYANLDDMPSEEGSE